MKPPPADSGNDPDARLQADAPRGWEKLRAEGKSAQEWARERGFSPQLVYAVLRGERKCFRGKSHRVAVELGLKADPGDPEKIP